MDRHALATRRGCGAASRQLKLALATVIAMACFAAAGCGSAAAPSTVATSASASPSSSASATSSPIQSAASPSTDSSPASSGGVQLVVLADSDGIRGLWSLDSAGVWKMIAPAPGVSAIGRDNRDLVLASSSSIERRPLTSLESPGRKTTIAWHGHVPTAAIVSVAASADGRTALIAAGDGKPEYFVLDVAGNAAMVDKAPTGALTPLVCWIEGGKLLALSADAAQASRIAVMDPPAGSARLLQGLSGIRYFAVSPDGRTLAAATDDGVYVDSVATWLADRTPPKVINLPQGQVVWDLAMDARGTSLAMLSGRVADDGSVADTHELVYRSSGSAWEKVLDTAVPFGRVLGQVWIA